MQRILFLIFLMFGNLECLWAEQQLLDEAPSYRLERSDEGQSHFEFDLKIVLALHTNYNVYLGEDVDSPDFSYGFVPSISYYNFFLEAPKYRISSIVGDFNLGYHAVTTDHWVLDIIGGSYIGGIDIVGDGVEQGLDGLSDRRDDVSWGLRYSYYGENTFASFDLVGDVFDRSHGNWMLDSFVGYRKAIGNWDLTIGLDHLWVSAKTVDYYLGVSAAESRPGRPMYQAGASSMTTIEFLAEYPLSEHWVFDSGFITGRFGTEASNSSLLVVRDFTAVLFALVYVF